MIKIRSAELYDNDRIFELLGHLASSRVPDRVAFDESFPFVINDDNSYLQLAHDGGLVLGYSLAVLQWVFYANGPILVLHEIIVDPAYRGQGIGKALVESLINDAQQAGATEITVPTRRAKAFYPKFGFEEVAGYFSLKIEA